MRKFLIAGALALGLVSGTATAQSRTFVAEGTDVAQGVGARSLGMAGSGYASASDPHAIYYNPALLAGFDRPMVAISRQGNAELRPYSFVGFTTPFPLLEPLGFDLTFGFANFPRVHARSSGAFGEADPQSVFLRLLLPGLHGTYDGDIDSKTLVWRFAAGLSHQNYSRLKFGVAVDFIDCKTETCGVQVGTGVYDSRSVHAVAWSLMAGVSYDVTDRLRIAASVADIDTTLYSEHLVTRGATTTRSTNVTTLPRNYGLEASWQATDKLLLVAGYKAVVGSYGDRHMTIQAANLSGEYTFNNGIALRGGLWRPLKVELNDLQSIALPVPVVPTVGAGWSNDHFSADLAVHVHPIMSYHLGRPAPTAELSLSYRF